MVIDNYLMNRCDISVGGPSRLGPSSAYPQLDMPHPSSHSTSDLNHVRNDAHNAFTIKVRTCIVRSSSTIGAMEKKERMK